jgi:hypothetical protein
MKTGSLLLITSIAILTLIVGCQETQKTQTQEKIEKFPDFLVGKWIADPNGEVKWAFIFEADGSILKFRHFVGMDFVVAEGGLTEPWKGTAEATYGLGPCYTEYDPNSRNLSVVINIDNYIITFPDGSMEGSFHDTLSGPVGEDGSTWAATWNNITMLGGKEGKEKPREVLFQKKKESAQ